jgi:hypothetical protein
MVNPTTRRVHSLRSLAEAVAALASELQVGLPPGSELRIVTPSQAALLEFFAENPFCTIEHLEIHAGDPHLLELRLNEVVAAKIKLRPQEQKVG